MKHFLAAFLLLALSLPAAGAFAQDAEGTDAPAPTNAPLPPPPPKDPAQQPGTNVGPNGTMPRDIFKENEERPMQVRPFQGSSTGGVLPGRPPLPEGAPGMQRPQFGSSTGRMEREPFAPGMGSTTRTFQFVPRQTFSSTTKQAILERREGFASTTKAIIMERRALFASSTAAKIMDIREKQQERMEHFASTTALRKAEFTEDMKARILAHAENAAELMDAMLGRLAGIAERINARIDEVAAENVDTSVAEAELAEAYDAIEAAEAAVQAAKDEIAAALDSEDPKAMLGDAKSAGEGAKEALRAAHEALMEAAQALPKPPVPEEDNAE